MGKIIISGGTVLTLNDADDVLFGGTSCSTATGSPRSAGPTPARPPAGR